MKKFQSLCFCVLLSLSAMAQGFRNPIIPGYHPDPSVCRVGDKFYLVNSSFQYFPGVPIFESDDLVNWKQIGNVLDREEQLPLKGASSWLGIYAPTLRWHDGLFYMITTNVGNGGNFMVTATDPAGPWSKPVWLKQEGIDPSLFFENGKCYMVSNPDNSIMMCEIDASTGEQLTESRLLWRGTGGRYPEGPHIYKKDGYYYLLISEGGTELAHKLTIARSKNIYGPYTANPANPLLTHCSMAGQGNVIQGTGHGDFVQAKDGSWWIAFLAYRNFGGSYHHLGRETFLAPVEWQKGKWPVVNGGQPVDTLMTVPSLPLMDKEAASVLPSQKLLGVGPEWIHIQNPDSSKYVVDGHGGVRLYGAKSSLSANDTPTFLARRLESFTDGMTVTVDGTGLAENDEVGLSVHQIHDGHYDIFLRRDKHDVYSVGVRHQIKSLNSVVAHKVVGSPNVTLGIHPEGEQFGFCLTVNGVTQHLTSMPATLLSTEVVGGFTGAVIGIYAVGTGYADFKAAAKP